MNEDIKKQAHSFLVEKGCKSMAESYPAYRIEQMLTEFAERQIKLFYQCNVSGRSEQLSCGRNITTCLFYKEGGKCSNLEYCRDQTT